MIDHREILAEQVRREIEGYYDTATKEERQVHLEEAAQDLLKVLRGEKTEDTKIKIY